MIEHGAYNRVVRCTLGSKTAEVDYLAVQQEMLRGSHRLCKSVESIRMMTLTEYLARNEDASLSVGLWAPQKIVDALAARTYTICDLCTLASFGQIVPRKHVVFLHCHSVAIANVTSVLGRHCVLYSVCSLIKSRIAELTIVAIDCRSTPHTPHASNMLRPSPAWPCLWSYLVKRNWHKVWEMEVAMWRIARVLHRMCGMRM